MTYKHRQTFIIEQNDIHAQNIIKMLKDKIRAECGVEPQVMESRTAICLEWCKTGEIEL